MENHDQKIILPEYKIINQIKISHNVISDLLKFKSSKKAEGILFGRETNEELIVSSIIPYSLENSNTSFLSAYLEYNRYDYMRVGFFFVENNFDTLSQNRIKTFVEFQKTFQNNIIIMIDSSSLNVNVYPFKIFRMSKELMDKIDMIEIEENASLLKKENVDEFYKNSIFKKLNPTIKLIEKLNFEIISDKRSLMKNLVEKNYDIKNLIDDIESNSDDKLNFNYTFNKKINELNKNCEKFIDEQRKYINYYRNKKYLNLVRKKEGIKKGGGDEKLDLMEIGIQSNNIKSMNEKIKELLELNKINKFSNFTLI